MTVLELIESYYKNEHGAKKITKKNLTDAVRAQFIPASIKIGRQDFDILAKFGAMTFKSASNPDEYKYFTRTAENVAKDLEQNLSAGITGKNKLDLGYAKESFLRSLEDEKHKQAENAPGSNASSYIIRAIFNRNTKLDLPEATKDAAGKIQGSFIKTAGSVLKKFLDSGKLVLSNNTIAFKYGNSFVKLGTKQGEVTRVVLTSTMLDISKKLDEKYPNLGENEKATAALLATFITLRGVVAEGEEEAVQGIIEALAPFMLVAMEGVKLETKQLRKIALDVANAQLSEFGAEQSGEKFFQALAIEGQLSFVPSDPKDVPSSFVREGGMFPYNYITIEGKPNYVPLQYFTPDSEKVHDVNIPLTLQDALKQIKEADIAQEALGGFYFFDKQAIESFDQKPTFKTICEVNLTNLLILANVEIDPQVKETMQQMFALPIIQSLDKLSPKERAEVITKAMQNFKKMEILPREAFAQIELLDGDRKKVKDAGKYGYFERYELDVNAPLIQASKKVAKRLNGILKQKRFDAHPTKSKERTVISKAAMLLNNAQFYLATADGQCYGQNFQVWLDAFKQKYPEIVDNAELETLLRVVYEPMQQAEANFDRAKTKTKFTRASADKLVKKYLAQNPTSLANEAVKQAFQKPSKGNPTLTI